MVIVGPSGSGKTTLWQLLRSALQKMGNCIKSYTMNPKAMPRTQVTLQADSCTTVCFVHAYTYGAIMTLREPVTV